ncbi:hypothetical protein PROFUN_06543 [Planoprotostelium fungivorum]|uniref:Uncharacterized protein n=1 Tax=Planoprotostelium fungivorum TaxID=1890364 RepID=A0A2P6MRT5_9EUKA|nr:hypothetical protein PROFUN_06543 [Planoprotostelium fungivorum]
MGTTITNTPNNVSRTITQETTSHAVSHLKPELEREYNKDTTPFLLFSVSMRYEKESILNSQDVDRVIDLLLLNSSNLFRSYSSSSSCITVRTICESCRNQKTQAEKRKREEENGETLYGNEEVELMLSFWSKNYGEKVLPPTESLERRHELLEGWTGNFFETMNSDDRRSLQCQRSRCITNSFLCISSVCMCAKSNQLNTFYKSLAWFHPSCCFDTQSSLQRDHQGTDAFETPLLTHYLQHGFNSCFDSFRSKLRDPHLASVRDIFSTYYPASIKKEWPIIAPDAARFD